MNFIMRLASLPVILGGLIMFRMTVRTLYLRLLSTMGGIGLRLFPSIYGSLDDQNVRYGSGNRVKEKYLDKEEFTGFLKNAEESEKSCDEILLELEYEGGVTTTVLDTPLEQIFDGLDRDEEVAVQYSGGCDSTLAATLAARYFRKVHLISFYSPFILKKEKGEVNADKLVSVFGPEKVIYVREDTSKTFDRLLFGNYFSDLRSHKSFVLGVGCLACKLSFDVHIVRYALKNNVSLVLDGADLSVRSQLSQGDEGVLRERYQLYRKYGIEFRHPVARFENNAHELFILGTDLNPPQVLYAEQPVCVGNQFLNEIYDRFYFLPKYGLDRHSEAGMVWLKDKLGLCEALIDAEDSRGRL